MSRAVNSKSTVQVLLRQIANRLYHSIHPWHHLCEGWWHHNTWRVSYMTDITSNGLGHVLIFGTCCILIGLLNQHWTDEPSFILCTCMYRPILYIASSYRSMYDRSMLASTVHAVKECVYSDACRHSGCGINWQKLCKSPINFTMGGTCILYYKPWCVIHLDLLENMQTKWLLHWLLNLITYM